MSGRGGGACTVHDFVSGGTTRMARGKIDFMDWDVQGPVHEVQYGYCGDDYAGRDDGHYNDPYNGRHCYC